MNNATQQPNPRFNIQRTGALALKEGIQAIRDPSIILIAFVLPAIMLFLFAYAVSLDIRRVPIGLVMESNSPAAQSLAAAFSATRYFTVTIVHDRHKINQELIDERVRGYVVIPQDFAKRLDSYPQTPLIQIITDGSQPNTANFVANYAKGVISLWRASRSPRFTNLAMTLIPRFWFNPELESRRFLVPGAIAIVMTMIGTLLTAMVVAREWERGTMEAIMSTPASVFEILVGKLLPYFVLGLGATIIAALLAIFVFGVPLRGSWFALLLLSTVFLVPALGQGLLISAVAKNQFIAAQMALFSGFLPSFLLSGFLFEINSMPLPIRALSYVVPARYFVTSLQTIFLAGDIWPLFFPNMLAMLAIGLVFFTIARLKTRKNLDN